MQDNQPTHEEVINGKYFRTLTVPVAEPTSKKSKVCSTDDWATQ